jgi:uncharacterized Ntn-hydrolase superfamily protein
LSIYVKRNRVAPKTATYSIVAADLEAGQWGVAVQSRFPAIGALAAWARAGAGAVATQARMNPTYGEDGLALLAGGGRAADVVAELTARDPERNHRQLGVVDARGEAATYTGRACEEWAGGRTGPGFAAQGNMLVSAATVEAMAETFLAGDGRHTLAERLLDCLDAAQEAGGDRRGQQAAALLVVQERGGYGGLTDRIVDLRVDDHEQPLAELRRVYAAHQLVFGATPPEQWVDVDDRLAAELAERLELAGFGAPLWPALDRFANVENLEMRLGDPGRLDPVVVERIRSRAPLPGVAPPAQPS